MLKRDLYKANIPSFANALASLGASNTNPQRKPKLVLEGPKDPERGRIHRTNADIQGKKLNTVEVDKTGNPVAKNEDANAVPKGPKNTTMTPEGKLLQASQYNPFKATRSVVGSGPKSVKEPNNRLQKSMSGMDLLTADEVRRAWKHALLVKASPSMPMNTIQFVEKDNGPGYINPPSSNRLRAPRHPQPRDPMEDKVKFAEPYQFIRHKPKDIFDLEQASAYNKQSLLRERNAKAAPNTGVTNNISNKTTVYMPSMPKLGKPARRLPGVSITNTLIN